MDATPTPYTTTSTQSQRPKERRPAAEIEQEAGLTKSAYGHADASSNVRDHWLVRIQRRFFHPPLSESPSKNSATGQVI
jgi:hypothetical protein